MSDQIHRGASMVMSLAMCDVRWCFPGFGTWQDEDFIGRAWRLYEYEFCLRAGTKVSRMSRRCHAFLICIRTMRRALMHYRRQWRKCRWMK